MSKIIWSADKGWHDGPEATVKLDSKGRIVIVPVEGRTVYYSTDYRIEGSALRRSAKVSITSGYSTFEDLRKILAVKHYGSNSPEAIEKITILETVLEGQ